MGAAAALVLPADLPFLTPAVITAFLDQAGDAAVAVAPDRANSYCWRQTRIAPIRRKADVAIRSLVAKPIDPPIISRIGAGAPFQWTELPPALSHVD